MFRLKIEFTNPLWQEQWPYFKRAPIAWLARWFKNRKDRKEIHKHLDAHSRIIGLCRKEGESDENFRTRLMTHIRAPLWQQVFNRHGIQDFELREFGTDQVEVKTIVSLTDEQKKEITDAICLVRQVRVHFWSIE